MEVRVRRRRHGDRNRRIVCVRAGVGERAWGGGGLARLIGAFSPIRFLASSDAIARGTSIFTLRIRLVQVAHNLFTSTCI